MPTTEPKPQAAPSDGADVLYGLAKQFIERGEDAPTHEQGIGCLLCAAIYQTGAVILSSLLLESRLRAEEDAKR